VILSGNKKAAHLGGFFVSAEFTITSLLRMLTMGKKNPPSFVAG